MERHPLAGLYANRTIFAEDALQRLASTLDSSKDNSLQVMNLVGGGEDEWSTIELHATAIAKNGEYTKTDLGAVFFLLTWCFFH